VNSLRFADNQLWYLDQRQLPLREAWRECKSLSQGYRAIKQLQVRGAPLIGVFAAYCCALYAQRLPNAKAPFLKRFNHSLQYLRGCRPTAVNLFWALQRLERAVAANKHKSVSQIKKILLLEADKIHKEDIILCRSMAAYGADLIQKGDRILTHCNTGFLATSGEGTAMAVIYEAKRRHGHITVYANETRPLLQGARLSAWELIKKKIDSYLICDNAAAYLMQKGMIDKVFVGADRIAANGDTANKIGTYSVAVCARYHNIPFYVVAPSTSFDLKLKTGRSLPIEERAADEIRTVTGKVYITPKNMKVYNFAFDLTPHRLITAIVSDRGLIYPPFTSNIKKLIGRKQKPVS